MKKYIFIITLGLIFVSCSKNLTLGDYMQKEKDAIKALIAKEGFEVLNSFPDNGLFGENQFVLLDNGSYLNIINSGNGNRIVEGETVVLMRCGLTLMSAKDDDPFSKAVDYSKETVKFTYSDSYKAGTADQNNPEYTIFSEGVKSALKYISENAVVRMIIPSYHTDNSGQAINIGSAYQAQSFSPIYYKEIRFEFANDD